MKYSEQLLKMPFHIYFWIIMFRMKDGWVGQFVWKWGLSNDQHKAQGFHSFWFLCNDSKTIADVPLQTNTDWFLNILVEYLKIKTSLTLKASLWHHFHSKSLFLFKDNLKTTSLGLLKLCRITFVALLWYICRSQVDDKTWSDQNWP